MTAIATQSTLFDYTALDDATRVAVQQRTAEIKGLMKRAATDIIEIGQRLIEVKDRLGHGRFYGWLSTEFDWTPMTANRFMNVADRFKSNNLLDLNFAPSALYLLAAPSTPDSARDEAFQRAMNGENITHAAAREIVNGHKQAIEEPADDPLWWDRGDEPTDTRPQHTIVDATTGEVFGTKANHQLINTSVNNEWYTPARFVDAARELMGEIDLDPASCEYANRTVKARHIYTIDDDGYNMAWFGRVWLNPPYGFREDTNNESNQALWSKKLIEHYQEGNITEAILLVNAVPGNLWFAPLWDFPICFVAQRIRFYNEDTLEGQPTHSNVLVYLGNQVTRFVEIFSRFGPVAARLRVEGNNIAIDI